MRSLGTFLLLCSLLLVCGSVRAAGWLDLVGDDPRTLAAEREDHYYLERLESRHGTSPRVRRAEALLRDARYRSDLGRCFRVQTDDPRVDPEAVTRFLDEWRDFAVGLWQRRFDLSPTRNLSRAFLFYSSHEYGETIADHEEHAQVGSAVIAVHSDAGPTGELADDLVHQAAHHLVEREIYRYDVPPTPWVAEGLAHYYGSMKMRGARGFRPERIGGKKVSLFRHLPPKPGKGCWDRLVAARRALKRHRGELERLFRMTDEAEFQHEAEWTHGASWLLVHYLLHGEEGRMAEAFLRYVELDAVGAGGPDVFLDLIDRDPSRLERAVRRHARKIH